MNSAKEHLSVADEILARLIASYQIAEIKPSHNYFESLASKIVSQQLSVKAAAAIFGRLQRAVNGPLQPALVAGLTDQQLRAIGLSGRKVAYIRSLCSEFTSNSASYQSLDALTDGEVIAFLTNIHGIGRWTAEMFLMFTLGRQDVFAVDDLGLRRAIEKHYGVQADSPAEKYLKIAETWRPYRSVASQYLWSSLENTPIKS